MNRLVLLLVLLAGAVVALTSAGGTATAGVANPLAGLPLTWTTTRRPGRRGRSTRGAARSARPASSGRSRASPGASGSGRPPGPTPSSRLAAASTRPRRWGRCRSSWCCAPRPTAARRPTRAVARREDRATRSWYDALARAIGNDRVVIGFEPDSLGTIQCLARSRRDDRYRLLRHGVDALSKLPNATIYLDAGASDWESAQRTAKQLRMIGIEKVRGFMLNATHYDWTAANIRHGLEISRLTGGKHFVVNTAENGRGPVHYRSWISSRRHDQRLVQPGPARTRAAAHHRDVQPAGGRLPLDQPAGLCAGLLRPQDRLVSRQRRSATRGSPPTGRGPRAARASATASATRGARSGFRSAQQPGR